MVDFTISFGYNFISFQYVSKCNPLILFLAIHSHSFRNNIDPHHSEKATFGLTIYDGIVFSRNRYSYP